MFAYVLIKQDKTVIINNQQELLHERDSLENALKNQYEKIKKYESNIDSLEGLKSKIKYIYIEKDRKIDSASANDVAADFEKLFAANNVK